MDSHEFQSSMTILVKIFMISVIGIVTIVS